MALSSIARAIAEVEGYFKPGTVAARLNNPGNLVYVGQQGATPAPITGADGRVRTFARFASPEAGEAALDRDLALKAGRGLTIEQTIQAWLGNTTVKNAEGDPILYTHLVASRLGVSPSTPLADVLFGEGTGVQWASSFPSLEALGVNGEVAVYAGLGIAAAVIVSTMLSD